MKNTFPIVAMLFCAFSLTAQIHISIDEPSSTWTAQKALSDYIGQTVIFDDPIVVCSNANSSSLVVSPWRMFEPKSQGETGSVEYRTAVHVNSTCRMALTNVDGYHRCGEKVYNLKVKVNSTSSLSFISGEWRGNTRADLNTLPDLGDYRLLVCAMNLENYYMTLGSMGAKTEADRQKQRAKVSKALAKINADIYGLIELQQGNEAIAEIVSDLNNNLPERDYRYFTDAGSGTMQKSDYVYDANRVEPIGLPVEINAEIANRKKMICFREKATGEKFIYSINHFKSMNTGGADTRSKEATAVLDRYKSYRSHPSIQDRDMLLMGDLNTYAFTEPIAIFLNYGLLDLHRAFHADSSYSYMFGGLASYIDHAISSETLFGQITGMAAYTINSDEADAYTYDKSNDKTMFRSSDHDPVLVGLRLDSTQVYDPSPQINSADVFSGNSDQMVILNAYNSNAHSYYAIYSINGFLMERKEIDANYYEVQLPTAPGTYIVYIYYNGEVFQRRLIVR